MTGNVYTDRHRLGRLGTGEHTSVIPQGKLWGGGDKGGGSMKMNFQILNVPKPNAVNKTCIISIYENPDTKTNSILLFPDVKSR